MKHLEEIILTSAAAIHAAFLESTKLSISIDYIFLLTATVDLPIFHFPVQYVEMRVCVRY